MACLSDILVYYADLSELLIFNYFNNSDIMHLRDTSKSIAQATKYYFVNGNFCNKIYRIKSDHQLISDIEWNTVTPEMVDVVISEKIYVGALELLLIIMGKTNFICCEKIYNYVCTYTDNHKKISYKNCYMRHLSHLFRNIGTQDIYQKYLLLEKICTKRLFRFFFYAIIDVVYNEIIFETLCNYYADVDVDVDLDVLFDISIDILLTKCSINNAVYEDKKKMFRHLCLKYSEDKIMDTILTGYYVEIHLLAVSEKIFIKSFSNSMNLYFDDLDIIAIISFVQQLEQCATIDELMNDACYVRLINYIDDYNKCSIMKQGMAMDSLVYYYDVIENLDNSNMLSYHGMNDETSMKLASMLASRKPIDIVLKCADWLVNKFMNKKIIKIIGHYASLRTIIGNKIGVKKSMLNSMRFNVIKYIIDGYPNLVYNRIFANRLICQDKKFIAQVLKYMCERGINIVKFLSMINTNIEILVGWIVLFGQLNDMDCINLLSGAINIIEDNDIEVATEDKKPYINPPLYLATRGYINFNIRLKTLILTNDDLCDISDIIRKLLNIHYPDI